MKIKILIILSLFAVACGRKNSPQIQYIDKIQTQYDTIMFLSDAGMDTIYSYQPCDSFIRIVRQNDTVYIREVKKVVQTKIISKRDTVYRTPIVTNNVKINNKGGQIGENTSVKNKKGDNINGDGNTIKKDKQNWWWIFLAGMLTWFIIQNVIWKLIKRYLVLPI